MSPLAHNLKTARRPQQSRGHERFEIILEESRRLIADKGLSGFSIPELAERLGYTRTSIYHFFPTPYAILNELTSRYLLDLEQAIIQQASRQAGRDWENGIIDIIDIAARYWNHHPVGRLLVFGGSTDESFKALEITVQRLGRVARQLLEGIGVSFPTGGVDVGTLAVEIGMSSFRLSHFLHGHITQAYQREAVLAMRSYLANYVAR